MNKNMSLKKLYAMVATLIIVVFSSFLISIGANAQESTSNNFADTKIVFTDDMHSYIDYEVKGGQGVNQVGFAKAAALKKEAIKNGQKAYMVDAGDIVRGTIYSVQDHGAKLLELVKNAGYDMCVPGNHEWDFGYQYFIDHYLTADHVPYYACNCDRTSDGKSVLPSYKIVETTTGKKIGLFGIMTPVSLLETPAPYFQDNNGNWQIYSQGMWAEGGKSNEEILYGRIQETINKLKDTEHVDYVIGVSHIGIKDEAPGQANVPVFSSKKLINNTYGMNALIDGHSHTILNEQIKNSRNEDVLLVQAGGWEGKVYDEATQKFVKTGMHIGEMTISENEEGTFFNAEILDGSGLEPDAKTLEAETDIVQQKDTEFARPIIKNNIQFAGLTTDKFGLQEECSMGNLAADSIYWYTQNRKTIDGQLLDCDAAMINANGIKDLPSDATRLLTGNDCVVTYPLYSRSNLICVSTFKGQQIQDALEYGSKYLSEKSNNGLFYVAGMKYKVDTSIPYSATETEDGEWLAPPKEYRVHSVEIYDKAAGIYVPLDLQKDYKIAGSDYIVKYRSLGNTMLKPLQVYSYDGICLDALMQYLDAFKASSLNAEKVLSSLNSPLYNGKYLINYENIKGGAGTIVIAKKPDPKPDPDPSPDPQHRQDSQKFEGKAGTAQTSDHNLLWIVLLISFVLAAVVVKSSKKC